MNTTSPAPAHRPDQRTDHADGRASRNGRVMPGQRDELLTVPQVLEILVDVSPRTFYRWRETGKAPSALRLPNGDLRIWRSELTAWLDARREVPA